MARQTKQVPYAQRKAQILAALANGPMCNPELATYLGCSYHVVLRATRRMENQRILAFGTRGSVAGWVIADPVPVGDLVAAPVSVAPAPAVEVVVAAPVSRTPVAIALVTYPDGNGVTTSGGGMTPLQEAERFVSDRAHFAEDVNYPLVLSLYAAMTHCYQQCLFVLPYVGVRANTDSAGKTRLMQLIGCMCLRPTPLLTNPSGASLLRRIDKDRPTLLVDESEELQKPNSATREIFNSGYKPGGIVTRAQGAGERSYGVYCAKIYGMIGDPDHPLRARSIMVLMEKGDIRVDDKQQVFEPLGAAIGLRLSALVNQNVTAIESTYLGFVNELRSVLPVQRDREIWESLFAVCKHIVPDRLDELTAAAQGISTLKTRPAKRYSDLKQAMADAVTYQYAEQLARDSYQIAKATGERNIHTHTLITELVKSPTWKFYQNHKGVKIGDADGHYVLATMLQRIAGDDSNPKPVKVENQLLRGYTLDWLEKAAARAK